MKPEVEVEVRPEPMDLFAGDIVLLSSDGLTDLALAPDILGAVRQALASSNVEHACKTLVDLANNRGGHDNITVQMARVLEVPPKARATIPQAPSGADAPPASLPGGPPSAVQRPQETFLMTAPDQGAGAYAPNPQAAPQPQAGAQQWAPVPPTATDIPPQAMAGPGPTVPEQHPGQAWNGGTYQAPPRGAPPGQPPGGLAAYRLDSAGPAFTPAPPPAFSSGPHCRPHAWPADGPCR
ncbi:MAG: hypothetical protein R3B70_28125 [Polyangiaceae bacterium]